MGRLTGSTVLLCVALAIGPMPAGQASSYDPLPRAQPAPSAKPTVTKLVPQSASTAGGVDVVIKGKNLSGAKWVLFGATRGTDLRIKNAHKLIVQAPPHEAGLVRVRVVTKDGGTKQSEATHFTYVTPPAALTQLSPRTGPTAGGTTVTITGSGLAGATGVRFGATIATSFKVVSATTITAVSPARPAGPVNVTVATAAGSSTLDDAFTYVAAPTLSFASPGQGPLVATPVTLVGTGLTADARVTFGGAPATVLSASPDGTELTVNTPGHAAGFVDVVVTTAGGSATLGHGYLFVGGTTLTAVTPSSGPSSGGPTVTLTGTGFTGDTLVTFANKPAFDVHASLDGTQLTATLPSHAAGPVDVSVATTGGSATLANAFTYVDAPTLATVTPTAGPTTGTTSVTLTGALFRAGMQVRIGGVLATGVTIVSATQATAVTPGHSAGAVDVSVTTPGGTATLPGGFTYVAAPTLTAANPNEGPTAGSQSVTLSGTNFRAGMQVRFGGILATVVSVDPSGTLSTVTTPPHGAGVADVSVTTPGGVATFADGYTYVIAPTLTAVSPDVGPIGGGTTVTLTGCGFSAGMQVRFGTLAAALVSVAPDGTSATVTTPAQAAPGVVDVSVLTPGGTSTLPNAFTYLTAPTLTAASPNEGPTTGVQPVTLTGSGFRTGMQVRFGADPAALVSVNPAGTSATVTTPLHGAGVVDVSVTTPGGAVTLPGGYTYVAAPTLSSVAPDTGPAAGGTTVTLAGSGFRAGMQVSVGGTPAVIVSINPAGTSLTATTPAHDAGLVDVSVTTPGGSDTLDGAFTYVAPPMLASAIPTDGPAAGGTAVTLTGSGLTGTTGVTFDGVPATDVLVVDDGTVTVTTPAHDAGLVDIVLTTTLGTATLTGGFTYLP